MRCQDPAGAIRDAWDSSAINMDNNMGYALAGLAAAYTATGDGRYLEAMRRGLEWLAGVQDADGAWHWGYRSLGSAPAPAPTPPAEPGRAVPGTRGLLGTAEPRGRRAPQDVVEPTVRVPSGISVRGTLYSPFVGAQYLREGITGIRSVDAIQAYFPYALYLYAEMSGDEATRDALLPAARRAIAHLMAHNHDGTFFYSSWREVAGRWVRLDRRFSAGQADVYLGLRAMWRLTGEREFVAHAERLRTRIGELWTGTHWMEALEAPRPYRFSHGYLPYVFATTRGLAWLAENLDDTTIALAALALGLTTSGFEAASIMGRLADRQGHLGGLAFGSRPPFTTYSYTGDTAFAILAWAGTRRLIP
ncbi:MAG: hypothetical protein HY660_00095 [Armatimonadetes bacterium]|nr:hypothetical protein [Armatimonadota bacterium]